MKRSSALLLAQFGLAVRPAPLGHRLVARAVPPTPRLRRGRLGPGRLSAGPRSLRTLPVPGSRQGPALAFAQDALGRWPKAKGCVVGNYDVPGRRYLGKHLTVQSGSPTLVAPSH